MGKALAEAVVDLVGVDVDCSYLLHIVYDFPNLIMQVGHILRVSMEGFEHANKVTKAIFNHETSRGEPDKGLSLSRAGGCIRGTQRPRIVPYTDVRARARAQTEGPDQCRTTMEC